MSGSLTAGHMLPVNCETVEVNCFLCVFITTKTYLCVFHMYEGVIEAFAGRLVLFYLNEPQLCCCLCSFLLSAAAPNATCRPLELTAPSASGNGTRAPSNLGECKEFLPKKINHRNDFFYSVVTSIDVHWVFVFKFFI